jgi:hypothetical protein
MRSQGNLLTSENPCLTLDLVATRDLNQSADIKTQDNCVVVRLEEGASMELNTIIEIVRTGLSFVLPAVAVVIPFLTKSGAGKSLWRHISVSIWIRRWRKAGFSEKEIRKMLEKAFLAELVQ